MHSLLVVQLRRLTGSRAMSVREPLVIGELLHHGHVFIGHERGRGLVVGPEVAGAAILLIEIKIKSALLFLRILLRFGTAILEPILRIFQPCDLARISAAGTHIDLFQRHMQ